MVRDLRGEGSKVCVKMMLNLQDEMDYEKLMELGHRLSMQVSGIKMDQKVRRCLGRSGETTEVCTDAEEIPGEV